MKGNKMHTPTRQYYEAFEPSLYRDAKYYVLEGLIRDGNVENRIGRMELVPGKINILILGSATPRNIETLVQLLDDTKLSHKDNGVFLIDFSIISLDKHDKRLQELRETISDRASFHLVGMDMREMAFREGMKFNMIFSDFTLSFCNSLDEVDNTFSQIKSVLDDNGVCFMRFNVYEGDGNKPIVVKSESGVEYFVYNKIDIERKLEKYGLELKIVKKDEKNKDKYLTDSPISVISVEIIHKK